MLDTDRDGTLSRADMPGRWDAMCEVLECPSAATLSEVEFVSGMRAMALRRRCTKGLVTENMTHEDAIKALATALNNSLKNACKEIHGFLAPPSKGTVYGRYEPAELLGKGTFGTVRRCFDRETGASYALKSVKKGGDTAPEDVQQELAIMQKVGRHECIVGLIAAMELPDAWCFVLELATGGELFGRLAARGNYSERDTASVVRQVASALAYIHGIDVVHRDLKPTNLLLRSRRDDTHCALADFGLSGTPPLTGAQGTPEYMSPEQWASSDGKTPYGCLIDCWALGVLMFNMLDGTQPFDPDRSGDEGAISERVTRNEWNMADPRWQHVSAGARELIRALIEPDSAKRRTATQLLASPWVNGSAAPSVPLPDGPAQLERFNSDQQLWRAAVRAVALLVRSPFTALSRLAAKSAGFDSADPGTLEGRLLSGAAEDELSAAFQRRSSVVGLAPPPITAAARAELRVTFDAFDGDGNGYIERSELKVILQSLGADDAAADESLGRCMSSLDTDGDGKISFEEFCSGVATPLFAQSEETLQRAFNLFDANHSGFIDPIEFKIMLAKLHMTPADGQSAIDRMFRSADADNSGEISFPEFIAHITSSGEGMG